MSYQFEQEVKTNLIIVLASADTFLTWSSDIFSYSMGEYIINNKP